MSAVRKITIQIESDILEKAQASTGLGVTETVREGLRRITAAEAGVALLAMRGRVKFDIDIETLRKDRR